MRPSFEQFVAALRDPQLRAGIGLVIEDADAASLLSREDWATDYFQRWIAMFPAEPAPVAPAPAAAPAPEPAPVAAPAFVAPEPAAVPVPEPSYLSSPPPSLVPAANRVQGPAFAAAPLYPPSAVPFPGATRLAPPPPAKFMRLPFIIAGSIAGLILLAGFGLNLYQSTVHAVDASHQSAVSPTVPRSAPTADANEPAPDDSTQDGKYGLSSQEYELMEAAAAPYDVTLEKEVANGTTDAQLRAQADAFEASISKTCDTAASLPNAWDNKSFAASFEAGFESTSHATPEQAARVYQALKNYCLAD